MTSLTRGEEL